MTAAMDADRRTLVCFSHLNWDFVFQRPQHLLTRAAKTMRVLYWEEPAWFETCEPGVDTRLTAEGITIARPRLPWGADYASSLRRLLDQFLRDQGVVDSILWFYTPAALEFAGHLQGDPIVYDCMDELSAFAGADPALPQRERMLLSRASVVFTGGQSLYEAKRAHHPSVHAFPSGVDVAHFHPARTTLPEPSNQEPIPHPRAGFFGVVDERLDRDLLAATADLRPGIQFVLIGPIAKLDPEELPQRPNLHYLGAAAYADLPAYIAHWDVALMPFAMNDATRFISPTKTPEYLAAGRPVVSTPIADVVRRYGGMKAVQIASDAVSFAASIDRALRLVPASWQPEADQALADMSWDRTWERMADLIQQARSTSLAAE